MKGESPFWYLEAAAPSHTHGCRQGSDCSSHFPSLSALKYPKKLQNGQLRQFRESIPNLSESQSFFTTAPSQAHSLLYKLHPEELK